MTKRIFRSILVMSLIAFVACAAIVPSFFYEYFRRQIDEEISAEATAVAAGAEAYGTEYLALIKEGINILWIGSDGNEIYSRGDAGEADGIFERNVSAEVSLSDGSRIIVTAVYGTVWDVLLKSMWLILLVVGIVVVFSVCFAKTVSKKIVQPINAIDLENPNISDDYIEITPLLHKVKRQNELIALQLSDLKQRRHEFEAITENMGEGLVIIDSKGEILSYNRSALRFMSALESDEGVSVYDLEMNGQFKKAVREALSGKRSEFEWKQGAYVYQVFTSPVKTEDKISGALIFVLDVTEKAERENMRREFTANVSHELKTPLTSISGISEIMMNGIVKPQDVAGFAENIHSETQRLISLVNDIIKLGQLDENSVEIVREPVDLLLVAKEVKTRLRHVIEKSGVTFKLVGGSAVVNGNSAILSEMVYNLCDNAIKYNKRGGSVELAVGETDGHPYVRVSDTGIGIPQKDQARVFERFYRVDKSHSREIGGTGLGLSIVKHGAAYHGAEVCLKSKLNEGTTVEIRF